MALILGIGSLADLLYSLVNQSFALHELIRCSINMLVALLLFKYFNKKHQLKEQQARNKENVKTTS